MQIQFEDIGYKRIFFIEQSGLRQAELVISWFSDNGIIIEHTEVAPVLEGQGVGAALVNEAVAFARARHLTILPLCPFAHERFKKDPSLKDVWYQD